MVLLPIRIFLGTFFDPQPCVLRFRGILRFSAASVYSWTCAGPVLRCFILFFNVCLLNIDISWYIRCLLAIFAVSCLLFAKALVCFIKVFAKGPSTVFFPGSIFPLRH